ncbi:MAG: arylsulfatase [Verrucomicrobia bacterium]|jgi:arylsulfatase|nr:arylsulfatase [Verrucomicrobiota bacterium]
MRRIVLRLLRGSLVLACCFASLAAEGSTNRPNILLIVADDLGFSDVGCYGGEIHTPHLDRLGYSGLRFTQFYNTGRCWPTRASLLTGYYAQQVRRDTVPGVKSGAGGARPPWARLLPEMLRPLGYRSYHSGKWHIDGPRLRGGFDRSYSIEDHDRYFAPRSHSEDDQPLPAVATNEVRYVTTLIADHAIQCLQDHAAHHANRPFFHYLCFTAPHFPLQAPAAEIGRYAQTYAIGWEDVQRRRWRRLAELGIARHALPAFETDVGPPYHFPEALLRLGPNEVNRPLPWRDLTPGQREFQATKMAIHAAMIEVMDREIGRVLAQVWAMGAGENTMVVFLSDNGASAEIMVRGDGHDPAAAPGSAGSFLCLGPGWSTAANTPFRRHKTWVHEGGIATPFIVHWPNGIAGQGELRHAPAHVIDFVPTILEVVGAPSSQSPPANGAPPLPGRSLLPALRGDVPIERDSLWWQHEGNRALRVGDWKIVAAGTNTAWELYDLATDRGETRNLAGEKPEKTAQLAAAWQKQWEEIQRVARPDPLTNSPPSP